MSGNDGLPDLDLSAVAPQEVGAEQSLTVDLLAAGATLEDLDSSDQLSGETLAVFLGLDDSPKDDTLTQSSVVTPTPASAQIGEQQIDLAGPWHNSANPWDVNDDSYVSPIDLLLVINHLNNGDSRQLADPAAGEASERLYLDVSGDSFVSPIDVLYIVNYLNQPTGAQQLASTPLLLGDLTDEPAEAAPVDSDATLSVAQVSAIEFFAPAVDLAASLDPAGIYPDGQQFGFGAYTIVGTNDFDPSKTNMQRAADEGFTIAGPYYHRNWRDHQFIYEAASHDLRFTYQLRSHPDLVGVSLAERSSVIASLTDAQIAEHARIQLENIFNDPVANDTVARWSLQPDELRYWYPQEMRYLRVISETIREVELEHNLPHRPFWMYEPNNRTTDALVLTGQYQDIVSKGSYITTRFDRGDQRSGWAMWSFNQIVDAAETLGNSPEAVFQLSEDFTDPLTGTDPIEIRRVLRHDVYLSLVMGIKGVDIWSMFEDRPNLTTGNDQFEAYGSVAADLTGPLNLGNVVLFGQPRDDLTVSVTQGQTLINYTHTDNTQMVFDAVNVLNVAYGDERYLIVVNSAESAVDIEIRGLPDEYIAEDLLEETTWVGNSETRQLRMDPLGVHVLRIRQSDSAIPGDLSNSTVLDRLRSESKEAKG